MERGFVRRLGRMRFRRAAVLLAKPEVHPLSASIRVFAVPSRKVEVRKIHPVCP